MQKSSYAQTIVFWCFGISYSESYCVIQNLNLFDIRPNYIWLIFNYAAGFKVATRSFLEYGVVRPQMRITFVCLYTVLNNNLILGVT